MNKQKIHVGTSGWFYSEWKGPFYPAKCPSRLFLQEYQQHFHTSEINNSFYQLPKPERIGQWVSSTPENFIFCVKASRYITHMKKFKEPENTLPLFLERLALFGPKLGPVLFLVPPKFRYDEARLAGFLHALPKGLRGAFELRDATWHNPAAYDLLRQHGHALVVVDLKGELSPVHLLGNFMYLRFHGATDHGYGRYDTALLKDRAALMHSWAKEGREVFAYFDNDAEGAAPLDALELKTCLGG